jgi:hypothetical protein
LSIKYRITATAHKLTNYLWKKSPKHEHLRTRDFLYLSWFIRIEILVKKILSNSLLNWISKYRHPLFNISH